METVDKYKEMFMELAKKYNIPEEKALELYGPWLKDIADERCIVKDGKIVILPARDSFGNKITSVW